MGKNRLSIFFALLALVGFARAQTSYSVVQKTTNGNNITGDLTFGSSRTLNFGTGSTLNVNSGATVNGVLKGTPALNALGSLTPGTGLLPFFDSSSSASTTAFTGFSATLLGLNTGADWLTGLGAGNPGAGYVLTTTDATLPSAFSLGSLTSGLLKISVTSGVATVSKASSTADYMPFSAVLASLATNTAPAGALVGTTDAQTLSGKTIASPTLTGTITFPANTLQTFAPGATFPGINVGSVTADPGTLTDGSIWYNSTGHALNARINGATVALGSGGGGGGIGGGVGSTDRAIPIASGTGGSTLQGSLLTIDSSGIVGWPSNILQTFTPGATFPGLNVGSVASDPTTLTNGAVWYNSTANALNARINGATVALGAGGGGGGIGGSTGSTDTAILTANGTGGSTAQGSLVTINSSGVVGLPTGVRQTFKPSTSTPGLNFGSVAGDPSGHSAGDAWYNSSTGMYRGFSGALGLNSSFVQGYATTVAGDIPTYYDTSGGVINDLSGLSASSGTLQSTAGDLLLASATAFSTYNVDLVPASAGFIWNKGEIFVSPVSTFKGNANTLQQTSFPIYMQANAATGASILTVGGDDSIIDFQVAGGTLTTLSAVSSGQKSSIRFETFSGSAFKYSANIDFVATEAGSSGSGSKIDFYTSLTGTNTKSLQMTLGNDGSLTTKGVAVTTANSKRGTFTLSSGSATISNATVTAISVILPTVHTVSGTITMTPFVATKTAGTGFTVSGGGSDNSTYDYVIIE